MLHPTKQPPKQKNDPPVKVSRLLLLVDCVGNAVHVNFSLLKTHQFDDGLPKRLAFPGLSRNINVCPNSINQSGGLNVYV